MGLPEEVRATFDPQGRLAQSIVEFRPRAGQLQMAQAVAQTISDGGSLVVEAGTGVGKTFAYLVPALLSGTRVLVSTATKALQDQLYLRDIPRLMAVLGLPLRVEVLKGRSSYLCLDRLQSALDREQTGLDADDEELRRIADWARHTLQGDLSEVLSADDSTPVFSKVASTRDNCLGARCPQTSRCHVNLARKRALEADVVVINHHLFFADLNVRESGVAELLPEVSTVVFDEAHQLNDIGVQFMGSQLSTHQLAELCRDIAKVESSLALGLSNGATLLVEIEAAVQALRRSAGTFSQLTRLSWTEGAPEGTDSHAWVGAMQSLEMGLGTLAGALAHMAPLSTIFAALHKRTQGFHTQVQGFGDYSQTGSVRWIEVGQQLRLLRSPIDIAQDMQSRVFANGLSGSNRQKSWIFTSATLGHDSLLSWFVDSCGLHGAKVLKVESPFDHAVQSSLYIPADFPKPSDTGHTAKVAALVADAASLLRGRTMVLTTTLRAMHALGHSLRQHFSGFDDIEVLVQGDRPKQDLLQRFAGSSGQRQGCVLVGSASFWEGIDLPGDALQLLVIDKLPFAPPGDPLIDARGKNLELAGKSAFKHLHLPIAAVALKQGAGRLIRRESDRGILVVCDVRLRQMGYGRKLLAALPPMRRLDTSEDYIAALTALTRTSTRDPSHP